ncbi:MAG: Rab family GTPase [Promethearchaeota archaeon]
MVELGTLKILVCGEGGVGKSSLLDRYVHDKFDDNSSLTKGIGFFSKIIRYNSDSQEYNAIFWDFGGQMQFRFMLPNFVGGAVGCILAFDLTRFNSMLQIEAWIKELTEHIDLPILLVGTKYDLLSETSQSDDFVKNIIKNHDRIIDFMKTSAKDDFNVKKAFNRLIGFLIENKYISKIK